VNESPLRCFVPGGLIAELGRAVAVEASKTVGGDLPEQLPRLGRENEVSPLAVVAERGARGVKDMLLGELLGVTHLVQREGVAAPGPLGDEQHDLLLGIELQLVKQDQADGAESVAQPASNWFGVRDRQELCRHDHRETTLGFEEAGRVNE
jgi:hypothetical protein